MVHMYSCTYWSKGPEGAIQYFLARRTIIRLTSEGNVLISARQWCRCLWKTESFLDYARFSIREDKSLSTYRRIAVDPFQAVYERFHLLETFRLSKKHESPHQKKLDMNTNCITIKTPTWREPQLKFWSRSCMGKTAPRTILLSPL